MLKVGLTGGIGCGKSTVADAFRELGANIIDADQIARDIVKPNTEALASITKLFGDSILLENGELNRLKLKKIIFTKSKVGEKALLEVEKILHSKIRSTIKRKMSLVASVRTINSPYFIVDIPLLVEKNYKPLFNRIVVVDCLTEKQIERTKRRDNMDTATILKIIEQQATSDERKNVATDIIDNNRDVEQLLSQVKRLHQKFVSLSHQ